MTADGPSRICCGHGRFWSSDNGIISPSNQSMPISIRVASLPLPCRGSFRTGRPGSADNVVELGIASNIVADISHSAVDFNRLRIAAFNLNRINDSIGVCVYSCENSRFIVSFARSTNSRPPAQKRSARVPMSTETDGISRLSDSSAVPCTKPIVIP